MKTEASEYLSLLQEIQNNNVSTFTVMPADEPRFTIETNSRNIIVPSEFSFLSVQNDHRAETIYFEIDRYFDNVDLSQHACVVQFINKSGTTINEGTYPVTSMDIDSVDGKIVFGWEIRNDATQLTGDITFSVRFYSIDNNGNFTYNFNTLTASSYILPSLNIIASGERITATELEVWTDKMNNLASSIESDIITVEEKIEELENYIASIPEDYTALTEEVGKLSEEIENLTDGYSNIDFEYTSGKVDVNSGEIVTPYETTMMSDKVSLDKYSVVTVDGSNYFYTMIYEFDNSDNFTRTIVSTVYNHTFNPVIGCKYVIQFWYGGTDFSKLKEKISVKGKCLLTEDDKRSIYENLQKKTECHLDIPDKMFIVKGETLELFKYGMYYSNAEYTPNKYNVRVVNIDNYVTQYDDKIVITCPSDYVGETLRNQHDLPLFQLLDTYGKVIEQKRVSIYVGDVSNIANNTRKIMYVGDSLTGMGYRSGEMARLISQKSNLSNTRLIGKFVGNGDGNRFTGTGGYSWANYTENPNTLPTAYPNNYFWDSAYNKISTKYFMDSIGESQLDCVFILLGWNDYENGAFASSFSWDIMRQRAKRLIENIRHYYPTCKIVLESYHYMYPFHRKSYGNSLPQARHNKYVYDLNKFYQSIANEYDYVEFLQMSYLIDVLHNMTMVEENANKRTSEKVTYCADVAHPSDIGFYQYSDAEFATLVNII